MQRRLFGWMAAGALIIAAPATAHHSFAMFDREHEVKVEGTVHDFQWTNPHAWIDMDVPDGKGGLDRWGVELNSPNNLARQGWRSNLVKPGDKITVVLNPLRSGQHGGLFLELVLADGRTVADHYLTRAAPPGGGATGAPK